MAISPASTVAVTQARVLHSEWTKFRSLRSTVWTLLAGVALMIGISSLVSVVDGNSYHPLSAGDGAGFDPIATSLSGITFAFMAIGVLGVLLVTGEYSTGMIRSSMTAVPRRLPVLWGKLGVFAGVVLSVSTIASFVSFFVGQAVLSRHGINGAITAPGALRSVVGAALYMTVGGMIGVALGGLLRNTAAGISTFVGGFFVLPVLVGLLPHSITDHVAQYLPSNAGSALYGGASDVPGALSPWTGFAVLCGYAVILIGAAAYRLRRVDV